VETVLGQWGGERVSRKVKARKWWVVALHNEKIYVLRKTYTLERKAGKEASKRKQKHPTVKYYTVAAATSEMARDKIMKLCGILEKEELGPNPFSPNPVERIQAKSMAQTIMPAVPVGEGSLDDG
jgi:hypothetical protein